MSYNVMRRSLGMVAGMSLVAGYARGQDATYVMENAYPKLVLPDCVATTAVMDGERPSQIVGMQRGLIVRLPEDRSSGKAPVFLDFRKRLATETDFEEGLHGIVFHPDFKKNRRFYLSYSQSDPNRTVISEMLVKAGANGVPNPASERILMEIPQPLGYHWAGSLAFGPDGYLYISIGDGGLRDDTYRLAQNPWSLNGKILRIDVNGRTGALPYAIPSDNPFAAREEIRSEIWAMGFRNPWSLAFDRKSGMLWTTDVGQDTWEEINIVAPAGNYGWSEREGPMRFSTRRDDKPFEGPFIDPVYSYGRAEGICVIGGMVYRGERLPTLSGKYLFGDWGQGKLSALTPPTEAEPQAKVQLIYARGESKVRFNPTAIGEDVRGEPLIFSHYPAVIYTLAAAPVLADADHDGDGQELEAPKPSEESSNSSS